MDIIVNANAEKMPANAKPLKNEGNYFSNILACLGFDETHFPLAHFLALYYGFQGNNWLLASPIHWEASHNDAMITNLVLLDETASKKHFKEISAFLNEIPMFYISTDKWLFNIDNCPPIKSAILTKVLSQSLMPIISNWDKDLYWQRVFTEIQMFLNQSNSFSQLNGLWFWGEGQFSLSSQRRILTDDPKLIALGPFITKLDETSKLNKKDLLILKNEDSLMLFNLLDKTKKHQTNWYWNNLSYNLSRFRWWPW